MHSFSLRKEVYEATGKDCMLYSKNPVWTEYGYKSDRAYFDFLINVIILYFIHMNIVCKHDVIKI